MLRRARWLEDAALLLAAAAVTLRAEWAILFQSFTFQPDAQIHTFWMRRFQDPHLFTDPLTRALIKAGYVPLGVQELYRAASYLVDPVTFGPWLALVLAPLSAWLVFRIIREHTDWWPAAWLGAALFIVPANTLRFSGGHARAFAQPVVLLTVYLLLRRRWWPAAAVPPVGALLYPPAAVSALAIAAASCLTLRGGRPRLERDRTPAALVSTGLTAVALLLPRLLGHEEALITEARARALPDFGPNGQMHFFSGSIVKMLRGAYSGLDTTSALAILLLMPLVLLALRPRTILLLRRELLWMPITSAVLFALSYAVLFRLYLPNRYTYPLLPFACVAIAVGWRPTFERFASRRRLGWLALPLGLLLTGVGAYVAVRVIPLGPQLSRSRIDRLLTDDSNDLVVALVLGAVACALVLGGRRTPARVAVSAVLTGALLLGVTSIAGGNTSTAAGCGLDPATLHYLGTVPKDAIVAGDPTTIGCVTMVSERPVVISRKLYQVFSTDYLHIARQRMFAMVEAYFGDSFTKIDDLHTRYGADYLVVQPGSLQAKRASPQWKRMAPFTGLVTRLLRSSTKHAVLDLPDRCRTWKDATTEVFDLRCVISAH